MKRPLSSAPSISSSSSSCASTSALASFSLFGPSSGVTRSAQYESSPSLLGRSRAERMLDRAYTHQSKAIWQAKRRRYQHHGGGSTSSPRRASSKPLPSPTPAASMVKDPSADGGSAQNQVDPLDVLGTLLFRHLPGRAKYAKSVELVVKLIQSMEVFVSEEKRKGKNPEEQLKTEEEEERGEEGEETDATPPEVIGDTATFTSSSPVAHPLSPSISSSCPPSSLASPPPSHTVLLKTEPLDQPPVCSVTSYKIPFLCALHHIMVVQQHCATTVAQCRTTIKELFEKTLLPLCDEDKDGNIDGGGVFEQDEVEYLRVLSIYPRVLYRLQTDDTYTFTSAMGALKSQVSLLKKQVQEVREQTKTVEGEDEEEEQGIRSDSSDEAGEQAEENIESPGGEDIKKEEEGGRRRCSRRDELLQWKCPKGCRLLALRRQFVFECLHASFRYHQTSWAKASVEGLFQQVYLDREIFDTSQQEQISTWQAEIKAKHKGSNKFHHVSTYGIGEAKNPVRDGRDERISTMHGSVVWSSKQMGL
eukprot:GHVS01096153.1.p1 GENE.GHVS01096153.1~~GHVS01096153.1.p1  ORF type:complete len:533 (+),score=116.44 GHVS01096153.1:163-1761(+)